MQKSSGIGGRAVLGLGLMRNGGRHAVAVRSADHEIEVKTEPYKSVIPIKGDREGADHTRCRRLHRFDGRRRLIPHVVRGVRGGR